MARQPDVPAYKRLADIFSKLETSKQNQFLRELQEHDEDAAGHIRALMFTFADLIRVEPRGIQILLREVDVNELATALKGAPVQILNLFFNNMSDRAAQMFSEQMDAMGPVRMDEVELAQRNIAQSTKLLANRGEIRINDGEQDDDYTS